MSFISVMTGKLYKKPEKIKLRNFPAGYVGRFSRNFTNNVNNFLGLISIGELQTMQIIFLKTCKNIYLQRVILQKECKQTLIITKKVIGLTTPVLYKY